MTKAVGPHIRRQEKQRWQRGPPQHRRQQQCRVLLRLEQRQQRAEFKQQQKHQNHHGDWAAARVLHDLQRALAVAEATQPGISAVGQPIEVQGAGQRNPEGEEQGRL